MSAQDLAFAVLCAREKLGISQANLGKRGGPSIDTMRLIENAHRDNYTAPLLLKLDRALGWAPGTSLDLLIKDSCTCTCHRVGRPRAVSHATRHH